VRIISPQDGEVVQIGSPVKVIVAVDDNSVGSILVNAGALTATGVQEVQGNHQFELTLLTRKSLMPGREKISVLTPTGIVTSVTVSLDVAAPVDRIRCEPSPLTLRQPGDDIGLLIQAEVGSDVLVGLCT
jgi:hypothetical protein